jgi:hypothetical protein
MLALHNCKQMTLAERHYADKKRTEKAGSQEAGRRQLRKSSCLQARKPLETHGNGAPGGRGLRHHLRILSLMWPQLGAQESLHAELCLQLLLDASTHLRTEGMHVSLQGSAPCTQAATGADHATAARHLHVCRQAWRLWLQP